MANKPQKLLNEIEAFLQESGMGASYFGKKAAGNSELVSRLRDGGRVWPDTEAKIRSFIKNHCVRSRGHGASSRSRQVGGAA